MNVSSPQAEGSSLQLFEPLKSSVVKENSTAAPFLFAAKLKKFPMRSMTSGEI